MQQVHDDINRAAVYALRHYVTLGYYARSEEIFAANGGLAYPCVCSGFVMRARDVLFLVTAGHVLDEIDAERKRGIELVDFRIWDGWNVEAKHKGQWLPFPDFLNTPSLRVNSDGLDYSVIPLRSLYAHNLIANSVVPVGEEQYEKDWPQTFDGFAMIGTAGGTVKLERAGGTSTRFTQSACVIQLEEVTDPPEPLRTKTPRFYGRILTPEESPEWEAMGRDIKGMSGGPVIGVRRDDEGVKYWVVGVQSGWLESKRIIAASYFQAFARFVGELVDDAIAEGK